MGSSRRTFHRDSHSSSYADHRSSSSTSNWHKRGGSRREEPTFTEAQVVKEMLRQIKSEDLQMVAETLGYDSEQGRKALIEQLQRDCESGTREDIFIELFREIKVDDLRETLGCLDLSMAGTREQLADRLEKIIIREKREDSSSHFDGIKFTFSEPVVASEFRRAVSDFGSVQSFEAQDNGRTIYVIFEKSHHVNLAHNNLNGTCFPEKSSNRVEAMIMSRENIEDDLAHLRRGRASSSSSSAYGLLVPPPMMTGLSSSKPQSPIPSPNVKDTILLKNLKNKELRDSLHGYFQKSGQCRISLLDQGGLLISATYDDASIASDVYHRLSDKYRNQGTPIIELLTRNAAHDEMEAYRRHALENVDVKKEPSYSRGSSERSRSRNSSSSRHTTSPRPSASRRHSRSESDTKDYQDEKRDLMVCLEVRGLVGSVSLPMARELFGEYGPTDFVWMTRNKKLGYAMYQNERDAKSAREGLDGLRWPEDCGKRLKVSVLSYVQGHMAQRQAEQEDRDAGGPRVPFEQIAPRVQSIKQKKTEEKRMKEKLLKVIEMQAKLEEETVPGVPQSMMGGGPQFFAKPFERPTQVHTPISIATPPPARHSHSTPSPYSIEHLMDIIYNEAPDVFVFNVLKKLNLPPGFVLDVNSRGDNMTLFQSFFKSAIEEARRSQPSQPVQGYSSVQDGYHTLPAQPSFSKRAFSSSSTTEELAAKRARIAPPSRETNILHFENLSPSLSLTTVLMLVAVERSERGLEEMKKQSFWISSTKTECYMSYPTVKDAVNVRTSNNDRYYPENSHYKLKISFATDEQVWAAMELDEAKKMESTRREKVKQDELERIKMEESRLSRGPVTSRQPPDGYYSNEPGRSARYQAPPPPAEYYSYQPSGSDHHKGEFHAPKRDPYIERRDNMTRRSSRDEFSSHSSYPQHEYHTSTRPSPMTVDSNAINNPKYLNPDFSISPKQEDARAEDYYESSSRRKDDRESMSPWSPVREKSRASSSPRGSVDIDQARPVTRHDKEEIEQEEEDISPVVPRLPGPSTLLVKNFFSPLSQTGANEKLSMYGEPRGVKLSQCGTHFTVTFATEEQAKYAQSEMNGVSCNGKTMTADILSQEDAQKALDDLDKLTHGAVRMSQQQQQQQQTRRSLPNMALDESLQQGSVRDDDELSSTLRIKNLAKYEGKQLLDELKKFGQVKFLFYAREGSYKGNFFVCYEPGRKSAYMAKNALNGKSLKKAPMEMDYFRELTGDEMKSQPAEFSSYSL